MKHLSALRCAGLALAGALVLATGLPAPAQPADPPPPRRIVPPPYGLRVAPLDEAQRRALQQAYAVQATYVVGLAYHCGLRLGDVIVAVNGQAFDSERAFWDLLAAHAPAIRLDVQRGEARLSLPLDEAAPECAG